MMKVSQLRGAIVFDEQLQTQDLTIYDKVGSIEGLKSIVASLFKMIANDPELSSFYETMNNVTL